MRLAYVLRNAAALGLMAFAATAAFMPAAFASVHANAHAGAVWMVVSVLASACAAKLAIPVTLFGLRVVIGAPVFLLLALPYFVRLLVCGVAARALAALSLRRPPPPAAAAPKALYAPYALRERCRRPRPPL
jgi:hypothetical protein